MRLLTAGISKKLVTIFASHLDSFIITPNILPFTSFVKPALDSLSNRDTLSFAGICKNCAMVSCQPGQVNG